jgi:RHS repeat-associated protein
MRQVVNSAVATPGKPGVVIDRIAYSAYSEATRTLRSDVNGDGFVNKDDYNGVIRSRLNTTIGSSGYVVEADLDRDGKVAQSDYDIAIADDGKSSSGGVGEAGLFAKGVRNGVGYCGYIFNDESGLYTVRFRTYSPTLGRWLERDPAGYVDGLSLYEYVRGGPITAVDPSGLSTATGDKWWKDRDRLVRTCHELDTAALAAWGALEPWDKDDVSVFVETQSCILKAIHKCVDCDSDEEWLRNVVRDFMTPFTRSLEERGSGMPITDPGWREFFRRLDAREIPATTLGAENGMLYDTLLRSFCGDAPIRMYFVRQLEIAQQMALNHIDSDLEHALRRNGIGDDKVWRCVGDAVGQCERDLLKGDVDLQVLGGIVKGIDENYDVQKLRDAMRERVRRMREEQCGPRSRCRQP